MGDGNECFGRGRGGDGMKVLRERDGSESGREGWDGINLQRQGARCNFCPRAFYGVDVLTRETFDVALVVTTKGNVRPCTCICTCTCPCACPCACTCARSSTAHHAAFR